MKPHKLLRCRTCRFVYMQETPSPEELNAHYKHYSYNREQYISPITEKRFDELLDGFEKYRKNNRLLDLGCGAGFFAARALKKGWDVHGTEYSEKAVELCLSKGIKMQKAPIEQNDFHPLEFDVVTSFEVVEHLSYPLQEVRLAESLLRPGGLLYLTTPNYNALARYYLKGKYNVIQYPEHLSYFTPGSLKKMMTLSGLRKRSIRTSGISLTRFKTSTGKKKEAVIAKDNSDEKLRRSIEKKWHLQMVKKILNYSLNISGTGATIKAYYQKGQRDEKA